MMQLGGYRPGLTVRNPERGGSNPGLSKSNLYAFSPWSSMLDSGKHYKIFPRCDYRYMPPSIWLTGQLEASHEAVRSVRCKDELTLCNCSPMLRCPALPVFRARPVSAIEICCAQLESVFNFFSQRLLCVEPISV